MRKRSLLWLLVFFLALSCPCAGSDFNVTDYHVAGDGLTLNTKNLQKLIDKVSKSGGGRVVFPAGTYLTGSLSLKSHVELHLEHGATLLGSTSPFNYFPVSVKGDSSAVRDDMAHLGLIMTEGARDIAITGEGTIDGQGRALALTADSLHHAGVYIDRHYNNRRHRPSELVRPNLLCLVRADGVRIAGVHFRNSAGWGLSLNGCRHVDMHDLSIYNRAYWNNDGIDITDCHVVSIERCNVNSADDGICLKSYNPDDTNDSILVNDCEIRSSASAVKFGTGSYGGFRNVHVSNIRVFDTFRSAVAIESVDGGIIENVLVENVVATNTGNALFLRLGQRAGKRKGVLKHVIIRNMFAQIPFGRPDEDYDLRGPEVDYFHNCHPAVVSGIPGNDIEDVEISNVNIVYPGRSSKGMAIMPVWRLQDVPEQVESYPEFTMFGELPSWGFYLRHVNNVRFKDITVSLASSDYRPVFVLDDAKNIEIDGLSLPLSHRRNQLVLRNSECQGNLPDSVIQEIEKK